LLSYRIVHRLPDASRTPERRRTMFRKRLILGGVLILVSFVSATADPSPGIDRKGFLVGTGLGMGNSALSREVTFYGVRSGTGVALDFKVGAGLTNRLLVYYTHKASILEVAMGFWGGGYVVSHEMQGAGVSYYLKDDAPSPYLIGAIGRSRVSRRGTSNSELAFGGGLGLELVRMLSFEFTLNRGRSGAIASFLTVNGTFVT
jgi:hypothetical protein